MGKKMRDVVWEQMVKASILEASNTYVSEEAREIRRAALRYTLAIENEDLEDWVRNFKSMAERLWNDVEHGFEHKEEVLEIAVKEALDEIYIFEQYKFLGKADEIRSYLHELLEHECMKIIKTTLKKIETEDDG